jgi:hypothetical protein
MFFMPTDIGDEPCIGDLQDDLLDIHADLTRGLWLSDKGHWHAALWEWRMHFDAHWGRHAAAALHALQGYENEKAGAG